MSKNGIWVHPDIIKKAKQVDLLTYLATCEPHELVRETSKQWCTKTHDSLKISNGYWNWCSVGIGGKNAVDYIYCINYCWINYFA